MDRQDTVAKELKGKKKRKSEGDQKKLCDNQRLNLGDYDKVTFVSDGA